MLFCALKFLCWFPLILEAFCHWGKLSITYETLSDDSQCYSLHFIVFQYVFNQVQNVSKTVNLFYVVFISKTLKHEYTNIGFQRKSRKRWFPCISHGLFRGFFLCPCISHATVLSRRTLWTAGIGHDNIGYAKSCHINVVTPSCQCLLKSMIL